MSRLSEKEYRDYLIGLKDTVFKVLYLYEEKNLYIRDYIDSVVNFELLGAGVVIEHLPHGVWYVKTINTLRGIDIQLIKLSDPTIPDNHKRIRREIMKIMSLIDKQIDQLKGE